LTKEELAKRRRDLRLLSEHHVRDMADHAGAEFILGVHHRTFQLMASACSGLQCA
jgi:hypothetical protein